ncbi:rab-GTPase-TBC domain-containing protein [Dichotomocladium elegans]|nr:rab-GTPase-TBC domain-containing protein [Dichotomocladium elegans]
MPLDPFHTLGAESSALTSTLSSQDSSNSNDTRATANTSIVTGSERKNHLPHPPEEEKDHSTVGRQQQVLSLEENQRREEKEICQCYESCPTTEETKINEWAATANRYGFLHEDFQPIDKRTKKFVERVYKGIPDCWRRDAWYSLCTEELKLAHGDDSLRQQYKSLLAASSRHRRQIDLDIRRTMRNHIMFCERYGIGQQDMFHILSAFSVYDEQVGYCQGMTNIVAMLLLYFEAERAFTALVHMFRRGTLHDLYIPGFPALMESFYIQEKLMERYIPKLYRHFQAIGLASATYATRWYMTLFSGDILRHQTLLRIWDVYFLVGYDVFFFVAITLLKIHNENCLGVLAPTVLVPDDDKFMKAVKKLYEKSASRGVLNSIRKKYQLRNRV